MKKRNIYYSIIASIALIFTFAISGFVATLTNKNVTNDKAYAYEVPSVDGSWLTEIENTLPSNALAKMSYLTNKSYNLDRNGTEQKPFLIMDALDLAYLAWLTNSGYGITNTGYYYALGADIDLAGKEWFPIGGNYYVYSDSYSARRFYGAIDGTKYNESGQPVGVYKIKNLSIVETNDSYKGLIGWSSGLNKFTNITFENAYISGNNTYYGILAGRVVGELTIDNIEVNGYVTSSYQGNTYIGGLFGFIQPAGGSVHITNVTNNAEVMTVGNYVGGISGYVDENGDTSSNTPPFNTEIYLDNVINNATITGTGYVAGLISRTEFINISNSANHGNIYASVVTSSASAGLIGYSYYGVNITDSYNTGDVEGYYIGGIIGQINYVRENSNIVNTRNEGQLNGVLVGGLLAYYNPNIVSNDYTLTVINFKNTGEIISLNHVGGVIGFVLGNIVLNNVRNHIDIISESSTGYAGGLIGYKANRGLIEIIDSYNLGNVITPLKTYAGGLIGYSENSVSYDNLGGVKVSTTYNLGNVEGINAGGFIGYVRNYLLIEDSFNMGSVTGSNSYAGGLIGYVNIDNGSPYSTMGIYRSYNAGEVSAGVSNNGGIVGLVGFTTNNADTDTNKTFELAYTINSALVQNSNTTRGLIANISFTTNNKILQKVNVVKSFSVDNATDEDLTVSFTLLPTYTNVAGARELVFDTQFENIEGKDEIVGGSRILTASEIRDIQTFINEGYDFNNVWAMPENGSEGNNGAPYLKDVAGIKVNLVIEGQIQVYNAVMLEPLNISATSIGKTFTGWSTKASESEEGYIFYPAGTIIPLVNEGMTLYANFETTKYYDIIVEAPSSGSLAVSKTFNVDNESYSNGIALKQDNNSYVLTLENPEKDLENFRGWQVWAPKSNSWYTIASGATLSLKERIDENFINNFAILYEDSEVKEQYYTVVGALRFRASKDATAVQVKASLTNDSSMNGTLKINGQDAPLTDNVFTTIIEGSSVTLQANPNNFYMVERFTVEYTFDDESTQSIDYLAVNNAVSFTLAVEGKTIKSIRVLVKFVKIEHSIKVIVQTKDVNDYTLQNELISGGSTGKFAINEEFTMNLEATPIATLGEGVRLRFVGYKIFNFVNNEWDYIYNANPLKFELDMLVEESYLSMYTNNGVLTIIAEYAVDYLVNINNETGGTLEITVTRAGSTLPETFTNTVNGYFEKGTTISINATPDSYYAFREFAGSFVGTVTNTNLYITLNNATTVNAKYTLQVYAISTELKDYNADIAIDGVIDVLVNSVKVESVKVGDKITLRATTVPSNYKFSHFQIKNGGNLLNNIKENEEIEITDQFLLQYLTSANKIVVIGRYIRQITVTVDIASNEAHMGSYVLRVKNNDTYVETNQRTFDVGTEIEIEAFVNEHHTFKGFVNVFDLEKVTGTNKVRITLSSNDRNVIIEFEPIVYVLDDGDKQDENLNISKDSFIVGDQVVITFKPESGKVIKSWKINGKDVNSLNNARVSANSVILTITDEWLSLYEGKLVNEVETAINPTILFTGIGVGAVIVILGATFITFFLLNAKKKKIVRAELKAREMEKYKFNTSSFIRDLREGKDVGQVTDEDVKAEMKRRKKDKK